MELLHPLGHGSLLVPGGESLSPMSLNPRYDAGERLVGTDSCVRGGRVSMLEDTQSCDVAVLGWTGPR